MAFYLIDDSEELPWYLPDTAETGELGTIYYRRLGRRAKKELVRKHLKNLPPAKQTPEMLEAYHEAVIRYGFRRTENFVLWNGVPAELAHETPGDADKILDMPDEFLGQFVNVITSAINPYQKPELPKQVEPVDHEEETAGNSDATSRPAETSRE